MAVQEQALRDVANCIGPRGAQLEADRTAIGQLVSPSCRYAAVSDVFLSITSSLCSDDLFYPQPGKQAKVFRPTSLISHLRNMPTNIHKM